MIHVCQMISCGESVIVMRMVSTVLNCETLTMRGVCGGEKCGKDCDDRDENGDDSF